MTLASLRSWLEQLAECRASVPAEEVLARLPSGDRTPEATQPSDLADLTLTEVAELTRRSVSTARTWCSSGQLRGAYRLAGKSWRVPRSALREFLDAQPHGKAQAPAVRSEIADDGNWNDWRGEP